MRVPISGFYMRPGASSIASTFGFRTDGQGVTLLVLLVVFGLPIGNLFVYISALIGVAGGVLVFMRWQEISTDTVTRRFVGIFLLISVPMLLSLVDAFELRASFSATARHLLFGLAGVALIRWLPEGSSRLLAFGVLAILMFWTADALLQYVTGTNIRGFPYSRSERLTGLFHPWPNIGYVMAVFSPVFFEAVRQWSLRTALAPLLLAPWLAVIFLSGTRSGWIVLALSAVCYGLFVTRPADLWAMRGRLVPLAVALLAASIVASQSSLVQARLSAVGGMFSGQYESTNSAASFRLPLWRAALSVYRQHSVNGVGPRGYPFAARAHLEEDPVWKGLRAGHPHLAVLEVAAETGTIGLIGYILFLGLLTIVLLKNKRNDNRAANVWFLTGMLAAVPIGTTIAFYAHMSTMLIWIPIGVGFALMKRTEPLALRSSPARPVQRAQSDA